MDTPKLEILNTAELLERLKIAPRTLYRLCAKGLPHTRDTSTYPPPSLFDWQEVQRWIADGYWKRTPGRPRKANPVRRRPYHDAP